MLGRVFGIPLDIVGAIKGWGGGGGAWVGVYMQGGVGGVPRQGALKILC